MTSKVRVRFAPSPSGYLHVGGARSALFNWLYARRHAGTFVLRIEDTDAERSSLESVKAIFEAMRWLGLDWDEGPDVGGAYGPYFQSERLERYRDYAKKIRDSGAGYHCYCTPLELEALREQQKENKQPQKYDGRCRDMSEQEVSRRRSQGIAPVIRLRLPDEPLTVPDVVKGPVVFDLQAIGDFVILRSNGQSMYNLACVVDDHEMEISHVIRGDEHLSNTPKQMMIYRALGLPMPVFAHIPMILGPDREKLSKRHGHTSVQEYEERGFLPDGMMNYLSLLGWSSPEGKEEFTREDLTRTFDIDRVVKNPAIFDGQKLLWLNAQHLRKIPPVDLAKQLRPRLEKRFGSYLPAETDEAQLVEMVTLVQGSLNILDDGPRELDIFYHRDFTLGGELLDEVKASPKAVELLRFLADRFEALADWTPDTVKETMKEAGKALELKGKPLFHTLRFAGTGRKEGPDLTSTLRLLGRKRVVDNLRRSAARVEEASR